jgi:uncharacterized protein YebE (UPF0316 family)
MEIEALLTAVGIFLLRVLNNGLGTMRVVLITRQRRFLASVLAFIEAWLFAVVISNVVKDLNNAPNLIAYCGGFAVGGYIAMLIESRYITSYRIVNIFTDERGHEAALKLRERGFGVTETFGEGRDGKVLVLRSVVTHHELPRLMREAQAILPDAFIAVEEARTVQHGYFLRHMKEGHYR